MDGPPSVSSAMARNFDREQPPVIEPYQFEEENYNPSTSEIRSLEDQPQPDPSIEARNVARVIVPPTETFDDGGQAVSIGAMAVRGRQTQHHQFPDQLTDSLYNNEQAPPSIGSMVGDRGNSQTAGGNFSYNAPPSYTDLARQHGSHTGESIGGQILPEGNYEGISLTGRNFGELYTRMFQEEDGNNPSRF